MSGIGGSSDTIPRVISGTGAVMVASSTITFTATNTYTGLTTVSNGTLLVNGQLGVGGVNVWGGTLGGTGTILGPVNIGSGGTLSPGASIGTFTISSNLNIAGNMVFEVNKSLAQSNDFVVVNGSLSNSGTGTITVSNLPVLGWPLEYGDRFTLFNKPVQNGSALTVTGAGVGWINNLEVDGSINVSPPILNYTNLGGANLQFSWTGDYGLQWQTNSLHVGLSNNWANYPGGGPSPVTVSIDLTRGAVFFRLVPVPVLFFNQANP